MLLFVVTIGCRKSKVNDDPLAEARIAAEKLPQVVTIEPYGLEARVPADWKCERQAASGAIGCKAAVNGAHWTLEPPNPSVDLEERARKAEAAAQGEEGTHSALWYGKATLAGFDGFVSGNRGYKRPEDWIEFVGTKDVPGHGRLVLSVWVGGDERDHQTWLAIAMSTKVGPKGIASSWPGEAETKAKYEAASLLATLADDNARERWYSAARSLSKKSETGRLAALVEGGEEAVRKLVVRRVGDLAAREPGALLLAGGEGSGSATAARLATVLWGWDDDAGKSALDGVEQAIVTAHGTNPSDARVLATLDGFVALGTARAYFANGRETTWMRMRKVLATARPELFTTWHGSRKLHDVLLTRNAEMVTWAVERMTTSKIGDGFDHDYMSTLFADDQVLRLPIVVKRLATLLALKTPDRASSSMRVCDLYARRLPTRANGKASAKFDAAASEEERDAWIAAWLRGE